MFERLAALALACSLMPEPILAQQGRDSTALLRTRLAQVDAQVAVRHARERQEAEREPPRHGRVQTEGNFTVLVRESVPRDTIAQLARVADSLMADFGGIPDAFVLSGVLVMPTVSDAATLLASPALKNRRPIQLDWNGEPGTSRRNPMVLLEPVARTFMASRDSVWQAWLQFPYGVHWDREADGETAIYHLTDSEYQVGRECLAGRLRSCRLWLGVDDDAQPYRARYKPEELVRAIRGRAMGGADGAACRDGEADACARVLEARPWWGLHRVPAPDHARASLVRALRELHGTEAVRGALADRAGSIGERLARSAGVSEDSLIADWRMWVLRRGRAERVSAGVGDVLTAMLFTALLVTLATRSGRWR
jgi:hypothetical protein